MSWAQAEQHQGGVVSVVTHKTLKTWPAGTFLESISVDPDGTVFIANHDSGALERVTSDGKSTEVGRIGGLITGILKLDDETFLATGRRKGGPESLYLMKRNGHVELAASAKDAKFLNGMTMLEPGVVLVADSTGGTVWRFDLKTRHLTTWLAHELLAHKKAGSAFPANTPFPAANGIKRRGQDVYVSNSDRAAIVRIPVDQNGRAGVPQVWVENVLADDFAFDAVGNLYIPTHPMNSIVKIDRLGKRTTIATGAEGVIGATAVAVSETGQTLYVVGNSLIPYQGKNEPARLVALDIGSRNTTAIRKVDPLALFIVRAPTRSNSDDARKAEGMNYIAFFENNFDRIALGGQIIGSDGGVSERLYLVYAKDAQAAQSLLESSPYFRAGVYGPLDTRPFQAMFGTLIGGTAWEPTRKDIAPK